MPDRFRKIGPMPFRFSRAELFKLSDAGIFPDIRVMLIVGQILVQPRHMPRHDYAMCTFSKFLCSFPGAFHVRNHMSFNVDEHNDPLPDLALVAGDPLDYGRTQPRTAAMIVEVSDATLDMDLQTKPSIYSAAKVPEYWVADIVNSCLFVHRGFRQLAKGKVNATYEQVLILSLGDTISPLLAPEVSIAVSSLLPPPDADAAPTAS